MPKTNSNKKVLSFPKNINRKHFGHWLSGFVDGEGHFFIRPAKKGQYPMAGFAICLREDDYRTLRLIHSYFGFGFMYFRPGTTVNASRQITYWVTGIRCLIEIVKHFDQYPLRAKKRKDFALWKRAVVLLYKIVLRKRRTPRPYRGSVSKWSDAERSRYNNLVTEIRRIRSFRKPVHSSRSNLPEELTD